MNRKGSATSGRSRLFTWLVALAIGGAMTPSGCSGDRDDRYELLRRADGRAPGEPTPLRYAADDDASAVRVRRLMSDEMSGELLRTFAMARRLVTETAPAPSVRRQRADAPPYLALGASDVYRGLPYRDRSLKAGLGQRAILADVPVVWIDDEPERTETGRLLASQRPTTSASPSDPALRDAVVLDQIARGFGQAILALIAPPPAILLDGSFVADDPLGAGYVTFLEVLDAEWHAAGGDRAAVEARTVLQHASWFAAVRANQGIERYRNQRSCGLSLAWPSDAALAREPLVIATFLYRLAASEAGHRLAADETYRSMVPELPPPGFSPGRLLGPFRNFQAKLLWAWNRAALGRHRPRDLVDLVEAYADAFPAERPEVTRIFLVTTYGMTVRPGGIPSDEPDDELASALASLTANVLFGRVDLRAGFAPVEPSRWPL